MAKFPQFIVPITGANLMSKLFATERPLTYISVEVGDGRLGSWQPKDLGALVNPRLSLPVAETPVRLQDGRWDVKAVMSNRTLTSPMQWREWGAFALDPDTGDKVMVAYSNAGDAADPIYPWDGTPESLVEYIIVCACSVISDFETGVIIDPTQAYVLKREFDNHNHDARYYTKTQITDITIDCGTFEDEQVEAHNADAHAHPNILAYGGTLEEHLSDPLAHDNIILDGNIN